MKRSARVAIAMSALAGLTSSSAFSQTTSTEAALAILLFDDAEKLMAVGNVAAACPKFAESQKLDPQLGTLLHLADCHEKVGKVASAWAGYKEAAEIAARRNAAGINEPRERVARIRAAALEPKLSTVVLHVVQADAAGLEIRRDGEPVGRALWGATMPVDPGRYTFAAQAPGKKLWTKTVDVRASGAKIDLTVPALEDATSSPSTTVTDAPSLVAEPPDPGATQRSVGYLLVGLGAMSAGVSVAFGWKALSQVSERNDLCPSDPCTTTQENKNRVEKLEADAQTNRTTFIVALALGGAAAAAGLALVLTAPSSPSPGVTGVTLVPWGGPNAGGAVIAGRW